MARVSFRQAVQDRSHRIVVERDDTLSGFRLASFNGQRGVDEVDGRNALAEALHKASLFFRYPLTSEFYGEAMVALKQVSEGIDVLSDEDKTKAEAIAQAIKRQSFSRP